MIEYKEVEEIVKTYKPLKITCDVCGKSYSYDKDSDDVMETQEFQLIRFTGGYGSVFGDEETVELHICQHCLQDKLGKYFRVIE